MPATKDLSRDQMTTFPKLGELLDAAKGNWGLCRKGNALVFREATDGWELVESADCLWVRFDTKFKDDQSKASWRDKLEDYDPDNVIVCYGLNPTGEVDFWFQYFPEGVGSSHFPPAASENRAPVHN